jgi:hypothetical protein
MSGFEGRQTGSHVFRTLSYMHARVRHASTPGNSSFHSAVSIAFYPSKQMEEGPLDEVTNTYRRVADHPAA